MGVMMKSILGLLLLIFAVTILRANVEATAKSRNLNLDESGLALEGYDPVSYHNGKAVKGENAFSVDHKGTKYLFSGQNNLVTFQSNPDKYLPAFGGWCAWAMLDGEKVKIDPKTYKIVNGTTYLFYNFFFSNTLTKWNDLSEQETEIVLVERAQSEWEKLNH